MNARLLGFVARAATLLVVLCGGTTLRSAVRPAPTVDFATIENSARLQPVSDPQGERLAKAYHILAMCDKDYEGHVPKAMEYIKQAAKMLGTDIDKDGIEDKKQGDSDDHLRDALELVRIVHNGSGLGPQQKKALVTVGAAHRELTSAVKTIKKK